MDNAHASGIPSGLIACRIGGEALRIAEISANSVALLYAPLPEKAELDFSFYRPECGSYTSITVNGIQNGPVRSNTDCGPVRFSFDDPACAAQIRRTLTIWSEYVQMKLSSGAETFSEKYLGYPKDTDEYFDSIEAQYAAWFSDFSIEAVLPERIETALVIDSPSIWKAFADLPAQAFKEFFAEQRRLPRRFFDSIRLNRLYIGSESCFHRFPDEAALTAVAEKAKAENFALSFVTGILHQSQMKEAQRRLDAIARIAPGSELIINDWGMLQLAQAYRPQLQPVLGALLNRFRRDARIKWKAGVGENGHLLSKNALNSADFSAFLRSLGIDRFEYACSPAMQLPSGQKSLHFPFYATNTSAYCPLKAYIEGGSRGAQLESGSCPCYCESNAFLYPAALNMLLRGRSILAMEENFPDPASLNQFDRLVFNF